MKLRTKILMILVVLMLIPTIALAKEVTDGTNYSIDVPDTYTEVADNQFRKDNGENFSVFTSEPLENTNLTEEEFKVITDYVVDQVKSEGTYTINHLGNEIVTVTKNNYKAYLAKFEMSAGSIKMILRQYYFVTPEKSVLFTETRFNESDYETAEAKGILDSLTLLNCTAPKADATSKTNEPANKSNALISEKTEEPAEKSDTKTSEKEADDLVSKKAEEDTKTDYVIPCVIIVVAVVAVLIIKKATAKKPNHDDNSNL